MFTDKFHDTVKEKAFFSSLIRF